MTPVADAPRGEPGAGAAVPGALDWVPDPLRTWLARRARWVGPLAAVAGGLLLSTAYPPLEWAGAAWLAPALLLVACRFADPLRAGRWGLLGGLAFWLPSLAWFAGLSEQGIPVLIAVGGWILLAAYCALYTGAFAVLAAAWFRRWGSADWRGNLAFMAAMPLLWAGLEYVRTYAFTGFPWNFLGVSQYANLPVIQLAEWGGVYAVSAAVLFLNAGFALTFLNLRGVAVAGRYRTHPELLLTLSALCAIMIVGLRRVQDLRREERPLLRMAVVQPAIPQDAKWDEAFVRTIYRRLDELTRRTSDFAVALAIWPETATPANAIADEECREFLRGLLTNGTPILVGSTDVRAGTTGGEPLYFNSSILALPGEATFPVYDKQHLTPLGERAPMRWMIPLFERVAPPGWTSLTPGRGSTVFRLPGRPDAPFAALICFEDAFPDLARRAVRAGARFLVDQSNDAWFDGTSGPRQHLAHCVFRCVENRVPAVRATNTGISAFLTSWGEVIRELPPGEADILVAALRVPPPDLRPTFFARHGRVMLIPCAAAALAGFVLVVYRERRIQSRATGPGPPA